MVIILQCIHISNCYVVHLKQIRYMSIIFYLKKEIHPQYVFKIIPPNLKKNSHLYIINGEQTTYLEITGAWEHFCTDRRLDFSETSPSYRILVYCFWRLFLPHCIVTTMNQKQLQPILRINSPEALTYTETII